MHRRAVALLLATVGASAAACGTDKQPLELEYLTEAIFAPACGSTQCHSTFRQAEGLVFDTVEGARRSLVGVGDPWLTFDYDHPNPAFPYDSRLYTLISQTVPFPTNPELLRMPLDAPLPAADIELLRLWIKDPAIGEPAGNGGYGIGAQCDPDLNPHRYACDLDRVVTCDDVWNFGELLAICPKGCTRVFPMLCTDPTCTNPVRSQCPKVPCDPENPEDMCRD
jgi:hypothetical protein